MSVNPSLSREQFEHLIPHSGSMVLIDTVEYWIETAIKCSTLSHQNPANPLRMEGQLAGVHLLEYGAQVMAIHGGLLTGIAVPGYLAAVRAAHFYIDNLDDVKEKLVIEAYAELKIKNGAVYQFNVTDSCGQLLLEARATVINTL